MTFKTRELTVDLVNEISTKEIRFSQGDRNSAKLVLNITNEGQELDLSQAKAVRITFKKPDGTTVFQEDLQPINAMKGKYQIILKTQTLAAAGNVYGQVRIFEKDQELDAEPFGFTVKQSYSGDGAVESTNEFTIIQKAIEAGEKLEGVDINGIIAAGELAKGALPKTGGTMTGILDINNNVPFGFKAASGSRAFDFYVASSNIFNLRHVLLNKNIFTVDGNGVFNVTTDTNLLKTTGGTMTGDVNFDPDKGVNFTSGGTTKNNYLLKGQGTQNKIALQDKTSGKWIWEYNSDTSTFSVLSESNLVKKAGDSFTGTTSVNNDVFFAFKDANGVGSRAFKLYPDGKFSLRDLQNGKDIFDVTNGKFNVNVDTNLVTKTKDGRATITLTADAELAGTNGVIADRRGNTVTLRAQVRRKAGSTGNVIFTMPSDMKPLLMATQNIIANDGTVGLLTVSSSGDVMLTSPGSTNVAGKDFSFVITYVVD
ncbi:hypothetical protein TU69_17960 [Bacillus cereus]|nr:hypothetical protein TU69_17960 [Bacillus cereus]